jgi:hydrogenase/urease accessory protein HupE
MSETEESSKRYDLDERTLQFARDVRAFIKMLPRTVANDEDTRQLVRASGSVGANYIEANDSLTCFEYCRFRILNLIRVSNFGFRALRVLPWLFAGALAVPAARAHEARPAYLEIKETSPNQFSVLWRTPVLAGMRLPVVLTMPGDVKNLKEPVEQELADSLLERQWIDAGTNGLAGKRIQFTGLQLTITDVLVRVEMLDGRTWTTIARPSQPWVEIAASQTWLGVAATYIVQGIRHILFGIDHLLFILGLMLIVKDRWMLVKTVTAFTVAHSITLAIATLGYAQMPVAPLNAAIALSILFLGPEIVRCWRGETSFTIQHPWVVAFAFGLVHGFGFASALTSAGLPRTDLPLALLSFNIGVELGQVAFVMLIVLLERSFRQLQIRWPRWVEALPGYAVGSVGAFWTIQRTAILLGAIR